MFAQPCGNCKVQWLSVNLQRMEFRLIHNQYLKHNKPLSDIGLHTRNLVGNYVLVNHFQSMLGLWLQLFYHYTRWNFTSNSTHQSVEGCAVLQQCQLVSLGWDPKPLKYYSKVHGISPAQDCSMHVNDPRDDFFYDGDMPKNKPTTQLNFLSINDSFFGGLHHHGHYMGPHTRPHAKTPAHLQCTQADSCTPPRAGPGLHVPGAQGTLLSMITLYAIINCSCMAQFCWPGRKQGSERGTEEQWWKSAAQGNVFWRGVTGHFPRATVQSCQRLPCNGRGKSQCFFAHSGGRETLSQRLKSIGSAGLTWPSLTALRGTHYQPKPPPQVSTSLLLCNVYTRQCPPYSLLLQDDGHPGVGDKPKDRAASASNCRLLSATMEKGAESMCGRRC